MDWDKGYHFTVTVMRTLNFRKQQKLQVWRNYISLCFNFRKTIIVIDLFVNVISYKLMNIFTYIFHCIRTFLHKKMLSQQSIQKKEKLYVISLIHCNEKKRHLGKDISFQNIMRLDSNLKYQCNISAWRIKSFVCAKAVKSNFLFVFLVYW